ncbi:Coenzyme F420 hydrogenase/dehydrogenase, beta subunit C-terminal domain [uncultured Tateyamaria sp.]|uniref:Coenzyme F420 hydrogenase/dehydrogenase, beta subunit C-terminal domain n=1 Tax=uncultured Tateyamaria sp. TaxID=455651 RepID=UPI0026064E5B|nr:Coenzyme F420 hydrogenase/dehydrogenase, beta subunit C-terminal domain [uncultured Tateyamaria sp.]
MSNPPVTPTERLYKIVQDGMCVGCGLCQSIAGPDTIRVARVENGYERPVVTGTLDHETMDRIEDVCPGKRLEGLPPELQNANTQMDMVWGPYQSMALAYATDPEVRFKGSKGGVLTALGQYLIDTKKVVFILHVKQSGTYATFGERHESHSAADVLDGAGSRYGPAAPLVDVLEVLDRGQPFAFVGKPCDISALRNLARHDPRVNELVKYWLTPVCGGFMPPQDMTRFLRQKYDVENEALTEYRFRGHGCPGKMRFATKDGEAQEFRYTDFWGTDQSMWTLPFRCKVCPDGIGEAADIAASDTWPGGSPDPSTEDDDLGTNAVIARTKAGLDLLNAAQEAGYVTVENECNPRYLDEVQPHQTKKKLAVLARFEGLRAEGHTVPRAVGLRLDELKATLSDEDYKWQFDGARERVRVGKASEPTPKLWERQ